MTGIPESASTADTLAGVILPHLAEEPYASVFEPGSSFPAPWRKQPFSSALSVFEGVVLDEERVAGARVDWYEMGFRNFKVQAASVGPVVSLQTARRSVRDLRHVYNAALDALQRQTPRPLVIRLSIAAEADAGIDALWRLGLGLGASCLIEDEGSRTVVQLQFPGAKAALATLIGTFPGKALAGRVGSALRAIGEGGAWKRSARDRHFTVLGFDTSQTSPPVRAPSGLRFREVSREEVERRPARYGVTPYGGVAPRGGQCFAGFLDGEIVYRMWLRFDDETVHEALPVEVRNAVQRPVALVSGCQTAISHRGKSIYPAALCWAADRARERGARQLLLFVNVENTASLRAVAKAGYTKIMDVVLGGTKVKSVHE